MPPHLPQRASPPRPPAPTAALERANRERKVYLHTRAVLEHRSAVRGLLLLALVVLALSIARAGLPRVFVPGWWAQW